MSKNSDQPTSAAAHALIGLKFINEAEGSEGWAAVFRRFDDLTKPAANGLLPRSLFWKCIGMNAQSTEFAEKLFDALCRRSNIIGDAINKEQLEEFWIRLSDQSFHTRLKIFFDMVDKDADGKISEEEVKEIICLSASINKLANIQSNADEYASLIMEALDHDKNGSVQLEELEMLLLEENPPAAKPAAGEAKTLIPKFGRNAIKILQGFTYFMDENWKRVLFLALWFGTMAGLFAYKYVEYKHRDAYQVMGTCVCLAKGAAETLKLNMALILFPVCRNTITWLRNKTKLGVAVPFDDNITFHQVIAVAIIVGVGIHGIAHLSCDFPRILNASPEKYQPMIPYFGKQPDSYWHFIKGVEGLTGLAMVALMTVTFTLAAPWFRRDKMKKLPKLIKKLTGFNAFWYSHRLFVIVYALLIVHGTKLYLTHKWYKKTTWMYLAVPMLFYAGEALIRKFRSNFETVQLQKVVVYTEKVLTLQMSKPKEFEYRSGQYMFLNCAAVSPFEWHPFSLTSAPGDDYLSLHIAAAGDWTNRLRTVYSKVCPALPKGETGPLRFDSDGSEKGIDQNDPNFPKLLIDGPYGAPAQNYKKYDVVLLVGLGIGATPMISIVKDILNKIKSPDCEDPEVVSEIDSPIPLEKTPARNGSEYFRTKRAYLYWVTREQNSFEWFKETMNSVAEMDREGVIEMHNYCTSVYEEGDVRSSVITMLQDLNHAKNGVDIVGGTRVKTHFGRPNWRKVYNRIADNHEHETVGVFYCGAPTLTSQLKNLSSELSHSSFTKFQFHKENF